MVNADVFRKIIDIYKEEARNGIYKHRNRHIFELALFASYRTVGHYYNISRSRVCQIVQVERLKLRRVLKRGKRRDKRAA